MELILDEQDRVVIAKKIARLALEEKIKLVLRAYDSVRIVGADVERSELYQVWQEEPAKGEAWLVQMKDLAHRLHTVHDALVHQKNKEPGLNGPDSHR